MSQTVTVSVVTARKTADYKGALVGYEFMIRVAGNLGNTHEHSYRLTPGEIAAGDVETVIKREAVVATDAAFKFFADPPTDTRDVVTDDMTYKGAVLTVDDIVKP